jgi:hypothetical protein
MTVFIRSSCRWAAAGLVLAAAVTPAGANDIEPTTFWKRIHEKGLYERVWERLRLYENEDNAVIEAVSLIGRYQGQFYTLNADQGTADDWENRRIFMGAEAEFFHQIKLHAQIKVSENLDPFYDGLFQALVKWFPSDAFSLSAGRMDALFTGLERSISSTRIATFERGLLVNQLLPAELVGALAEGRVGKVSYRGGVFSGSIEKEFTHFEGGVGLVAGAGYDLPLFYESGSVHLDYQFQDGEAANNAFAPYDHVLALWHQGRIGPFDLGVNLTWGHGLEGRPEVWGVTLLPTYVFAKDVICRGDAFQAVLRYQFAASGDDNGLLLQKRYEQKVAPGGSGDHYHAVYGGINYLIFGDRFKLMTGVEYSVMNDAAHDGGKFQGWTYLAGVRVYF